MDPIQLSIFSSRIEAVCDEMGAVLKRSAFSPNIKDRLDFSCAVFDPQGNLCAQAAHIPVHLGSMTYAMADIVAQVEWAQGDMVVVNDPYLGGTHLPDVTVIAPVFYDQQLQGFVANRAHHANIGATSPGSMPISSTLEEEGIIIPPTHIQRDGQLDHEVLRQLTGGREDLRAQGDFTAQVSANSVGVKRLLDLISGLGEAYASGLNELNDYAERLARANYQQIPDGIYRFQDVMDDDGQGNYEITIALSLSVDQGNIHLDFGGTSAQVAGNINCPLSVAAAAAFYVFRCLLPPQALACAGTFRPITLAAPEGCLVNACRPAAVAAGNVETSTRMVDVVLGALAQAVPEKIPAASHGSMNNVAMGAETSETYPAWDYYETIGGGMGASALGPGGSCRQTHMTNTLNTPIESLESHYPLRILRYQQRRGSGGEGHFDGGDGIVREYQFLQPAQVTLLTERRRHAPWGIDAANGQPGNNYLNGQPLAGKICVDLIEGDRLTIETPGGGAWSTSS